MTPNAWLTQLFTHIDQGWISLLTMHRGTGEKNVLWTPVNRIDRLDIPQDRCVWFGAATRREHLGDNQRGGAKDCAHIPALWVDIDIAGDAHKQTGLPPNLDAAHQLLNTYPLPPTAVINTGNGLQAWWMLTEPLTVDEAAPLLTRFGTTWNTLAHRHNWHIDNVFDIARVMRLPGTHNHKTVDNPKEVTIIDANWNRTYGADDIAEHCLEAPTPPKPTRNNIPYIGPQRPGDAYNAATDPADILTQAGCHYDHQDTNGDRHFRAPHHPNPNEGHGITVYADGHTTIWSETFAQQHQLQVRRPYDPFALYTHIHHNGNYNEASAHLRTLGYGSDTWETHMPEPTSENGTEMTSTDWEDPIPLTDNHQPPPFPIHTLPEWIINQCRNIEQNIQVVIDLPISLAIGALAVTTIGKLKVHYPRKNWTQPCNLYMVTAMPPSSGKSPAKNAIFKVLEELEQENMQKAATAVAEHDSKKRMLTREQHNAEETYAKTGDPERQNRALELATEISLLQRPANGRLMVDDATTEALGIEMRDAGGAIAQVTPEGGIFDRIAGMYADQIANLDLYLEAWGGGRYSVSRVKREGILVREGNLTLVATIQPTTLQAIGANPAFRGRGLTARLMLSVPATNVGNRDRLSIANHDHQAEQAWNNGIRTIHQWITEQAAQNPKGFVTLTTDDDAGHHFAQWDDNLEKRLKTDELNHMTEWVGKLRADVLRLAALLHIAESRYSQPIGIDTMQKAIEIGNYYLDHAKAVMSTWGEDGRITLARKILDWITTNNRTEITVRDLYRNLRRHFQDAEATRAPLQILTERGWIRPLFTGEMVIGRGGKASPRFAVHPQTLNTKPGDTGDTGDTAPQNQTCVTSVTAVSQTPNAKNPNENRPVSPVSPVAHKGDSENYSSQHIGIQAPDPRDTGATGDTALEATLAEINDFFFGEAL